MTTTEKLTLLLILILITACEQPERCYICDKTQKDSVKVYVERNIKASNNMSDEEMEDVINELNDTAIKLNCEQKWIVLLASGEPKYLRLKKNQSIYKAY